jgi:hypothetical protein
MLITNNTPQDYFFGPLHLPGGVGQTLTVDDSSSTSLYLTSDVVADAIESLASAGKISVSSVSAGINFPRATGSPDVLHGDGSPEGLIFAPQGSLYLRRDAASTSFYLFTKTTGVTLNTGWAVINPTAGAGSPSTSLPGSPVDGQQSILTDSTSAPTYNWLLQYSTAASKWLAIGAAAPLEGTTSITIPRAGTYMVEIGGQGLQIGAATNDERVLTLTAGGITLVARGGQGGGQNNNDDSSIFDKGRMTGLTASQVLTPTVTGTSPVRAYIRAYPVSVS